MNANRARQRTFDTAADEISRIEDQIIDACDSGKLSIDTIIPESKVDVIICYLLHEGYTVTPYPGNAAISWASNANTTPL